MKHRLSPDELRDGVTEATEIARSDEVPRCRNAFGDAKCWNGQSVLGSLERLEAGLMIRLRPVCDIRRWTRVSDADRAHGPNLSQALHRLDFQGSYADRQ